MNTACMGARHAAQNGQAIQNVVKSATHTRWKLQPLPMPKARTVRVVTPPEPQAGPLLLKADVHPITGFDESEFALSPKRGWNLSSRPAGTGLLASRLRLERRELALH